MIVLFPNQINASEIAFRWQANGGFFKQFWEKAPGQNWEKMIDLISKLGEKTSVAKYILKKSAYHSDMGQCFS